ncbi:hypothetical protein AAMO2058_000962000 [Amorphochlora amoebiformis]|uniref:Uncharacterized protein n=1 Tax=Amorphochlora amoebiformis TaxID=1561963 RepID=A0A7S0DQB2_9EUKA|mmetsp:Transcript_5901/g.9052  ORF Transcript_5901/g.9052 Transcript_5901/m.9052 type:complete len:265 (+) Transcript_5901:61-855(+)
MTALAHEGGEAYWKKRALMAESELKSVRAEIQSLKLEVEFLKAKASDNQTKRESVSSQDIVDSMKDSTPKPLPRLPSGRNITSTPKNSKSFLATEQVLVGLKDNLISIGKSDADMHVRFYQKGSTNLIAAIKLDSEMKEDDFEKAEKSIVQYRLGISDLVKGTKYDKKTSRRNLVLNKIHQALGRAEVIKEHLDCGLYKRELTEAEQLWKEAELTSDNADALKKAKSVLKILKGINLERLSKARRRNIEMIILASEDKVEELLL